MPILFNMEMTQALLDGRKTVTRRAIKYSCPSNPASTLDDFVGAGDPQLLAGRAPYQPGDVLYVRETWCALTVTPGGHMRGHHVYYYKADGDLRPETWRGSWRPSIHMPKEAARLFLRVTGVRVERLQDMDEEGAMAEGLPDSEAGTPSPLERFTALWDGTIKPADILACGWDANPWVWVIEFERIGKEAARCEEGRKKGGPAEAGPPMELN